MTQTYATMQKRTTKPPSLTSLESLSSFYTLQQHIPTETLHETTLIIWSELNMTQTYPPMQNPTRKCLSLTPFGINFLFLHLTRTNFYRNPSRDNIEHTKRAQKPPRPTSFVTTVRLGKNFYTPFNHLYKLKKRNSNKDLTNLSFFAWRSSLDGAIEAIA